MGKKNPALKVVEPAPESVSQPPRRALSKKTRFEVFKRDRFTCQYCGSKAPEVVLEVDHIHPIAEGGSDDFLNLATACKDCNGGKGARRLDQHDEVTRRRERAEALQERREQIAMMAEWQQELVRLGEVELDTICDFIGSYGRFRPNETGRSKLRPMLKKHGFHAVLSATEISFSHYYASRDPKGDEQEAWETAFEKIGGVLYTQEKERSIPNYRRLYYVRGILRKVADAGYDWLPFLEQMIHSGMTVEDLEELAKRARSRGGFKNACYDFLRGLD